MKKNSNQRGYASISTPDGKFRMWIPRPTSAGTAMCSCSFPLKNHLSFVDAIDKLDYLRVDEVREIDQDFSYLVISCLDRPGECLMRMVEDLPELMDKYLVKHPIKSE